MRHIAFLVIQKSRIKYCKSLTGIKFWKRLAGLKRLFCLFRTAQSFCSILIHGRMDLDQQLIAMETGSCFTHVWSLNIMSLKQLKFWGSAIKKVSGK